MVDRLRARRCATLAAWLWLAAGTAVAGRDGPVHPLGLAVHNGAAVPLACHARLAHWFALDFGRIAPGADLAIGLELGLPGRTLLAVNEAGDRMPVEEIYCGEAGRSYETRALLDLRPLWEAPAGAVLGFTCRPQGDRLACR